MSSQAHPMYQASPQDGVAILLNPTGIRQLAKGLLTAALLLFMASAAIAVKVAVFVPHVWQ